MKQLYLLLIAPAALLYACSASPDIHEDMNNPHGGELLFNSGFEGNTAITSNQSGDDYISGIDNSVWAPNDWSIMTMSNNRSPYLGDARVQYEGGTRDIRKAEIVADPVDPNNKVLHFWVTDPNAADFSKTRIQFNIYGSKPGIMKMFQRVRMYLPEGMATLKDYPDAITWLTIAEFWNNNTWSDAPYPFRLSIGMKKGEGSGELHFSLNTEDYDFGTGKFTQIYGDQNTSFDIPFGKWMTIEYYLQDGNLTQVGSKNAGYFMMTVTPEDGETTVIFSKQTATHNTHDPNSDGLTMWNPIKLYTSKQLMNWMKSQGQPLEIYWDDLAIWSGKIPVI